MDYDEPGRSSGAPGRRGARDQVEVPELGAGDVVRDDGPGGGRLLAGPGDETRRYPLLHHDELDPGVGGLELGEHLFHNPDLVPHDRLDGGAGDSITVHDDVLREARVAFLELEHGVCEVVLHTIHNLLSQLLTADLGVVPLEAFVPSSAEGGRGNVLLAIMI